MFLKHVGLVGVRPQQLHLRPVQEKDGSKATTLWVQGAQTATERLKVKALVSSCNGLSPEVFALLLSVLQRKHLL